MNEDSYLTKKANTWLLHIFGQILDQRKAIMSQMTAKHEGTRVRIHRKGVSCTKWPLPRNLHPQLGVQQATEKDSQGQLSKFFVK